MDEPGGERTNHGTMHGLIAIVTFIAIAAAAGRLGSVAKQVPGWTSLSTVSSVFAWLMVASLVAMMVVGRGARVTHSTPKYFGAVERVLYLVIVAWLVLVGVGLT
jgi:hypothetical protein